MATKSPARSYYQIVTDYALWWEIGGSIFPNAKHLVIATDAQEVSSEISRAAIQFETDAPAWITAGTAAEVDPILWMFLDPKITDFGSGIELAQINAAWDMGSTRAHMDAIAIGAWQGPFVEQSPKSRWTAFDLTGLTGAWLRNANGIMIRCFSAGTHRKVYQILKEPAPTGRAYYQYGLNVPTPGDATIRPALTEEQKRQLSKESSMYSLAATIKQSDILPAESDIPIGIGKGSDLTLLDRKIQWPESWKLKYGARGSISLSRSVTDLHDHRGKLLEVVLSMRHNQEASIEVAKILSIIGNATQEDMSQHATLEDPLKQTLSKFPCYRDMIAGFESVEWTGTTAMFILLDTLINAGGIKWHRFRYDDYFWLRKRFDAVWGPVTYTIAQVEASTISSIVEDMGKSYGIVITRGGDDAMSVLHPAAYRPFLRVHTLDYDDMIKSEFIEEKADEIYNEITVEHSSVFGRSYGLGDLPITQDEVDKTKAIGELKSTIFQHALARVGLCNQLAQRFCGRRQILKVTVGARALDWENNDQVLVTAAPYELDNVAFMVKRSIGDDTTGQHKVELLRYPDFPGLHSLFQDSDLQGIWRWQEKSSSAVWTGANMSWEGSAGVFVKSGSADFLNIDWRGPLVGYTGGTPADALTAPSPFFPTHVAGTTDVLDFVVGVYGGQDTNPSPGTWPDPNFNHICRVGKSGTNNALIFGIYRPSQAWTAPPNTRWSAVENKFFIGYTTNWTANPIIWAAIYYSPPGVGVNFTGSAYDTWRDYGIALKWKDTNLEMYVNQELIATAVLSKANFDEVFFMTPTSTEHRVGTVRWMKSVNDIESIRFLTINGVDEYYP